MPDKLPFDKETRAEIAPAAQTASAGGIASTEFWSEFENELGRIEIEEARKPLKVQPRR